LTLGYVWEGFLYINNGYWGSLEAAIIHLIYFILSIRLLRKTKIEYRRALDEQIRKERETIKENSISDFSTDPVRKLKELKSLLDEGVIDETTYKEKSQKYIDKL
ncbi:MAG: hypothetical protein MJ238_06855, partial [Bacilli bacterium]|nr:hypothetical protein [Bacilli bacterium]